MKRYHYVITITWATGNSGGGTRTEADTTEVRAGETRSSVFARLYDRAIRNAGVASLGGSNVLFFSLEPDEL